MNSPVSTKKRPSGRPRTLFWLLILVACCAQPSLSQSGGPPTQPVLRIETGMHTASIRRIGVDAANRFLVTASDDKTARLWELPSGRPLRVLRVPIGAGNEGKLYSVAISPDGSTIAAGGWTSNESGNVESIYFLDRESGRLVRRVGGLPNVVNHLAYSPDGRHLAAMLGGKNGVRVFSAATYAQAGEDRDYGGDSYGADFDRAGRLATTSKDGFIRLYAPAGNGPLRLIAKRKAEGGEHPFSVSFSPDGTRLAVGFDDSTRVSVLSGADLSPLYAPDTGGVTNGDLSKVAWSADGRTLYAGGRGFNADGRKFIRAWADGGRGAYRDILVDAAYIIMHILPLRDGGVIYGAGDPAFGAVDASGNRRLFTAAQIADYGRLLQDFLLAPDGAGVRFGYEYGGKSPARFSLSERRLEAAPTGGAGWRAPVTEAEGLRVTDWLNTYEPKLNGTRLKLGQYEMSRSLAIAPDRSALLLGTEYRIRLFDRGGAERWSVPAPDVAWAVNVSSDGRLAVAAYADGTIRWHSMKDGKELLAFFPHADRKRWVVWTPSGYYDASAGAEDLIGWHVNRGRDQAADFFPVGQFRQTFYRPDVVAKILTTGDEALALRQADEEAGRKAQEADVAKMLPPVVEIVSPADGSEVSGAQITVRYRVRTPSGEPVTGVRALVDGRPAAAERGLSLQASAAPSDARELAVALPGRDSEVSLIAENRFAASVPVTVRLKWRGAPAPSAESFEFKPKLYVLAVGVSNYADASLKLGFPAKDARDFAAALGRQKGGLYRDVVLKVLTDEQATRDEVVDGLDWIRKETTAKDVAVVLFAGHGVNDSTGGYFFLPYNADPERLLRTGVKWSDVRDTVAAIAGKTLFFVDTCHSGNILGTRRALSDDLTGPVNELASAENGAVVFAASTGRQYSLERAEWNNGAFTKAVVEAIDGRADYSGRGRITINMLDLYISERVKELTRGQQTPTTAKPNTVPDFPVALKR